MADGTQCTAITVILRTKGCHWWWSSGCTFCGYFNDTRDDVTSENLRKHISDYEDGKLKQKLKSQEEPVQETGKPFVLVGETFSKVTESQDVLVKFYAPWCGHCKKLAPIWDELALKMQDEDVKIAKFDATANEHESVHIQGFPTIKFYKGGNPIDYSGARNVKSFVSFLLLIVILPYRIQFRVLKASSLNSRWRAAISGCVRSSS